MINASIENITVVDDELFNRVRAFGPGDGIDRMLVTVEDSVSIAKYGVREVIQDFPEAVDYSDLTSKAQDYLDANSEPVTEIEMTFYFDTDKGVGGQIYEGSAITHGGEVIDYYRFGDERQIRRGDTIRIVSQSLGLNTTGVIEELDWQPGSVSLSVGNKRYNLIDVITGPEREEERNFSSLGLPAPIGLRASTAELGVTVAVNPYGNSRAVGVEIYGSTDITFGGGEPTREDLFAKGAETRFEFKDLNPGVKYYFKARSYDSNGNFSDFTDEPVGAIAGFLSGGKLRASSIAADKIQAGAIEADKIAVGAIDTVKISDGAIVASKIQANAVTAAKIQAGAVEANKIKSGQVIIDDGGLGTEASNRVRVVDDFNVDQVVMGKITGKPGVPTGIDYGFWGSLDSGVYIEGVPRLVDIYEEEVDFSFTPEVNESETSVYYAWKFSIPISSLNVSQSKPNNYLLLQLNSLPRWTQSQTGFGRSLPSGTIQPYFTSQGRIQDDFLDQTYAGFTYDDSFDGLITLQPDLPEFFPTSIFGTVVNTNNLSNLKIAGYFAYLRTGQGAGTYSANYTTTVTGKISFAIFESDTPIETNLSNLESSGRWY